MAGFASRWWSRLTHPYTRMGLRAGRTVALGAGIFGAGYSSGVQASPAFRKSHYAPLASPKPRWR